VSNNVSAGVGVSESSKVGNSKCVIEVSDIVWPTAGSGAEFEDFLTKCEKLHFSKPTVAGATLDFDLKTVEADVAWLHQQAGTLHSRVCALIKHKQSLVERDYLNVDSIKGFEGFSKFESLKELATEGALPWISPDFVPNKGIGTTPRKQYSDLKPAIHHQLAKLQAQGLILILPKSLLEGLKGLHLNQPLVVIKVGDNKGRVCVDQAASGLNASTLIDELLARDGELTLPGLTAFSSMIEDGVTHHNCKYMYKLDASGAFGRFRLSPAAALLQSVELGEYVGVMLNGCFGWSAAPKCYSILSDAIAWAHNGGIPGRVLSQWAEAQDASEATGVLPVYPSDSMCASTSVKVGRRRSETYVDDSGGISSDKSVHTDMRELSAIIKKLMGMAAVNMSKTEGPAQQLTIIGWFFDTERLTVRPSDKGLQKMLVWLCRRLKGTTESVKDLTSVLGLLRWYSIVVPNGSSQLVYLQDLVVWGTHSKKGVVELPCAVLSELEWWRSVLIEGLGDPSVWESSLSRISSRVAECSMNRSVVTREVGVEMYTDASTKVGGGFVIEELGVFGAWVWSEWEQKFFSECRVSAESDASINVLEFVSVVLAVVACKEVLKGRVVRVRVDNTSAVAWLAKNKSSNMLCTIWLRMLLSVLTIYHIQIQSSHVPGVKNVTADALSRQLADMVGQLESKGARNVEVMDSDSRKQKWLGSGRGG
jgi:hypothetical protein